MSSYESDVENDKIDKPSRLNISLVKYFWDGNPLRKYKQGNIPLYLRSLEVLRNFSDLELKTFSKYLHVRKFEHNECIFKQNDLGFGFYFIYEGHVDLCVNNGEDSRSDANYLLSLGTHDYFGELALLQEDSVRNASAFSKESTILLGLFKPDMHDLIVDHPVIGAKFLQSISIIVAHRLFSVTRELREVKTRLQQLEGK